MHGLPTQCLLNDLIQPEWTGLFCHRHITQSTHTAPPWCSSTPCQYALGHLWCETATQRSSSPQCFSPPASRSELRSLSDTGYKNFSLCLLCFFVTENARHSKHSIHLTDASTCVPCIGRPSCERMRIQWSDMLRMTRGCKATETLPVTPEAMTLGPTVVTWTHKEEVHEHNISDASAGLNYTFREE